MCGTKGKKTMCTPPRIGCFIAKSKGLGWLFDSWVLAFCMACHWKSIFSETQMCYGGDMKVATAWFLQMAGPREFQDSKNCHLIDLMWPLNRSQLWQHPRLVLPLSGQGSKYSGWCCFTMFHLHVCAHLNQDTRVCPKFPAWWQTKSKRFPRLVAAKYGEWLWVRWRCALVQSACQPSASTSPEVSSNCLDMLDILHLWE